MSSIQLELSELITSKWAEWYDESRIKKPEYKLRRLDDRKGNRYYYEIPENEVLTRAGITSMLQRVMPPSYAITEWNKKYGEKAAYMLDVSSRFGTSEHIVNKDWVVNKEVNQDEIKKGINYCDEYGTSPDMVYKDLVCFMKFCEDYKIKPLLCEAMLKAQFNNEWYALTLDLLCEITYKVKETIIEKVKKQKKRVDKVQDGFYKIGKNAGMPRMRNKTRYEPYEVETEKVVQKEITRLALVDFKSNFFERTEKDFYEVHLDQLLAAKEAVRQNFGLEVEILMNYSPNSWRSEPSYSKKIWEVTEKDYLLFNNLLEQARLRGFFKPQGKVFVELPINSETLSNEAYRLMTYEEYALLLESQTLKVQPSPPIVEMLPIEATA